MEVIFSRLHHIDFETATIELAEMGENAVTQYINIIIKETIENTNSRNFKIKDATTQVISIVNSFIDELNTNKLIDADGLNEKTLKIAQRLSEKEKESDDQISKMDKHVKKGSLIQSLVKKDDELIYIFAKVEYMQFLDRSEANIRTGLPLEKIILKTCLIYYNEDDIEKINIYDSSGSIADYWRNGLLELEQASSNETNTSNSFNAIDKLLKKNIKTDYPSDYTLIRNSLIGYYNQNKNFMYTELIDKVFRNYEPNNEDLNINSLCEKLDKLPENKNFERNFEIIPKIIRAHKKRVIFINPDIDLVLKDSTENLRGMIKGIYDQDGEYYLKIRVNQGIYRDFNYE